MKYAWKFLILVVLGIGGCNYTNLKRAPGSENLQLNSEPLVPSYESINKRIFIAACKDCHNSGGSGKRVLLDKVSLLNSPLELVIPGNPDESGLVLSLERNDDKRMPPSKEGYAPLKEEEKAVIRKWIENGAMD
ncbi:MAG TPA: c-type cytochrome domain-containing protein [Pseudobdellovibrionaceae bacterium]|jgi:hypothetical protein